MIIAVTNEPLIKAYITLFNNAKIDAEISYGIAAQLAGENGVFLSDIEKQALTEAVFLPQDVVALSACLFEYPDYSRFLTNFLTTFLSVKQSAAIFHFFNKALLNYIGTSQFFSRNAKTFDMAERTFDRFIEAVRFCGVLENSVLSFLFNVLEADYGSAIAKWKRPSFDYLTDVARSDQNRFLGLLKANFSMFGLPGFKFLIEIKAEDAVKNLTEFYINNALVQDLREVRQVLLQHPNEVINHLLLRLPAATETRRSVVELLLLFKGEEKALKALTEAYGKEKDLSIKKLIVDNINVACESTIKTESQITSLSEKLIKEPVRSFLGLYYDSFPLLDFASDKPAQMSVAALMLDSYFNLGSIKAYKELSHFKALLKEESLDIFCKFVFDRILDSSLNAEHEWAMLLIAHNSSQNMLKTIISEAVGFFDESLSDGFAVFLGVVVLTRQEFVPELLQIFKENKKHNKDLNAMLIRAIQSCGAYSDVQVEEMVESLAPTYTLNANNACEIKTLHGNIEIKVNNEFLLEVTYPNGLTENDYDTFTRSEVEGIEKSIANEIAKQKKRLYSNFETGKKWSLEEFKETCVRNTIFYLLAERLLWGKYKNGKLAGIFKLEGGKVVEIKSSENSFDESFEIGLLHPIEYMASEYLANNIKQPMPFNQLFREIFFKDNFDERLTAVLKFNGLFIVPDNFIPRILGSGWSFGTITKNGAYVTLLKHNPQLEMVAELGITPVFKDRQNESAVLGELRFFRVPAGTKVGENLILEKTNSLSIGSVPDRLFSDTIFEIVTAHRK